MSNWSKPSHWVSIGQAATLIDAGYYAFCINKRLNRMVTIHFEKGGVRSHADAHDLLGHFLKHAGDWLSKRGFGAPCYVYAFENPQDGRLHVHVLLHVPHQERKLFRKFERRWIRNALKQFGGAYRKGVLVDEAVFFSAPGSANCSDYLIEGLRNSLLYLLKGGEAGVPALFGLDDDAVKRLRPKLRPSPQGIILGKRSGFSEALSRKRHAFPGLEIGRGIWMSGPEARSRAILSILGLEFIAPGSRAPGYRSPSV